MVRMLVLYGPPADPEAFDRHYREVHIPLAKKLPGLRQYTVSRNASGAIDGKKYYLLAELDFDDMDSFQQALATPEGAAVIEDVPKFAPDGIQSLIYEVDEV
jgi:uncharacterized protein (TIGR02118 family)